ncbi:MAG: glucose-6-phosphate isomerase [Pontibacterium sp.]
MDLTNSAEWQQLKNHSEWIRKQHLHDLFQTDKARHKRFSFRNKDLLIDFSKQRIVPETLQLLSNLARAHNLEAKITGLFDGQKVNTFENRAALHTALRLPAHRALELEGDDIVTGVHTQLAKMEGLVDRLHNAQRRGYSGRPIRHVVHIGVGGSDLGPLMTNRALCDYPCPAEHPLEVHFASSMDGSQLALLLRKLEPSETLFIIASKSFSTLDTLANADTAKKWILESSQTDEKQVLQNHFIGISANPEKMTAYGISPDSQLLFWDWVGGRYSLWSCIGFPIALQIGMPRFREFLIGAHSMDEHFRSAPIEENIPVLMGLLGIWNINFLDIHAHAVLPYDGRLDRFPAYLEQLEMESNGKNTTLDQNSVDYSTCPIIWGEIGPNAQHAFYQLLHQGTEKVMCDFIAPARRYVDLEPHKGNEVLKKQHILGLSNCFAQSRVLAFGDHALPASDEEVPFYKRYSGNQPSTTILLDELTPFALGQLIALYEHKVFTQSVIWNINPFDQWGVELGKVMASETLSVLNGEPQTGRQMDDSTLSLISETLSLQGQ